ncbi:transcription initiation factor TFIID subunit 3-like [Haliotis asinina]|uniref:transcription initiation factor TFIID subunit 3-like n=1 Tax=Haliotis asinina TaxID=109174 RepID=UPI0035320176
MIDTSLRARSHSPNTFRNPEQRGRDGSIPPERLLYSSDDRNRASCSGERIIHLIKLIDITRMLEGDDDIDDEIAQSSQSVPTLPSLPEFDKILSDDVPRRRRRSRSPKKVQKAASGSKSVHKVKKQRPLLPKPAETITSSSTSHSPSIFQTESLDVFDISDFEIASLTSISIPHELSELYGEFPEPQPSTSLQDVNVFRAGKESKPEQEEEPRPSSSSYSRDSLSDIPLILDLASLSSEPSPVFERTVDEAIKGFVNREKQEESQKPGPSTSILSKKRPSDIPLTFDVSSSEAEASPVFERTLDEFVKGFVNREKQEESQKPGPSTSILSKKRPSDIPLTFDVSSSEAEASPVFERTLDEFVKGFVNREKQEESQKPGPSTSILSKKRPSDIPLTFDVSSSEAEASPGLGRTSDEVVKVFVYGEDQEVKQAAVESEKSQSVLPLIKEELRTRIQLKRLISGDGDTEPDIRKPYQMTLDELKKRERKKEQNRRAALRSRQKQTNQESEIIQRHRDQVLQNEKLEKEIEELKKERHRLIKYLERHFSTGCELPRFATDLVKLRNILNG